MEAEKLYECFTPEELSRLRAIKSDPSWIPRDQRDHRRGVYRKRNTGERDKVSKSFYISRTLYDRMRGKAEDIGVPLGLLIDATFKAVTE